MPYSDRDKLNEYHRNYRKVNADKIRQSKKKHWAENKEKYKLANKKYRAANKEKVKETNRIWWRANKQRIAAAKYGLTLEQYQILVEESQGFCPICNVALDFEKKGSAQACIDHNHKTGEVRKLICNRCNLLLGKAEDSPVLLRKAADYLESHDKD